MNPQTSLRAVAPTSLEQARGLMHHAVQLVSKAARANLEAQADDSHSNVGWDPANERFQSQPIPRDDRQFFVGLAPATLTLSLIDGDKPVAELELDGSTVEQAEAWLDAQLTGQSLQAMGDVVMPYELTGVPDRFLLEGSEESLATLTAWFDFAHGLLDAFARELAELTPGPSPVRCWPHHFDIATYLSLESGDPETARGIGLGLSPGDESYNQPYFYINPWPHLDPADLPAMPPPGHWHTEGFVGAVATGDEILSQDDLVGGTAEFLRRVCAVGREKLGI